MYKLFVISALILMGLSLLFIAGTNDVSARTVCGDPQTPCYDDSYQCVGYDRFGFETVGTTDSSGNCRDPLFGDILIQLQE